MKGRTAWVTNRERGRVRIISKTGDERHMTGRLRRLRGVRVQRQIRLKAVWRGKGETLVLFPWDS